MSREVLRDAIIYLPGKIIPALVALIAIPILTQLLSPEQYGQYLLAMTTLMLIASFCFSWLVSVTIRFYVVYGHQHLFQICRPWLVVSLLMSLLLWVAAANLLGDASPSMLFLSIGMLWLVLHGSFEYLMGWLRARNLAKPYSIASSWRSVAGLLITVALLLLSFRGPEIVILGAACATLTALIFLPRHALKADFPQPKKIANGTASRIVLNYGVPTALMSVAMAGLSLADRYIIGSLMGAQSVAIYGASYDIAEKTIFFVNSMLLLSSSVVGFEIFEKEGGRKAADFLSRLMRSYLLVAPPLVLGIALLAPQIIALFLPAQYGEGASVLAIVSVGALFVGVLHRYSLLLSFHKRTDLILWCSAGAVAINLFFCLFMIPLLGLAGAALSTFVAYGMWLVMVRIAANRYRVPEFPWTTLARVCGSLAISAGVMHLVSASAVPVSMLMLLASFISGMSSYAISLLLFGEVTRNDIKAILGAFDKRLGKF